MLRKKPALIISLVAIVGIAGWMLMHKPASHADGPSERPADSRNPVERARAIAQHVTAMKPRMGEWLARMSRNLPAEREGSLRSLLQSPTSIKQLIHGGNRAWLPTVLDTEDLAFAKDERLECGETLGADIVEQCLYNIDMAVTRTGTNEGVVQLVQARVEEDQEPVCEAFADCVAYGRIGKTIALPDEDRAEYGITQKLATTPAYPELLDPDHVANMINEERLSLEKMKADLRPDDLQGDYIVQTNVRLLAYMEKHLARLRSPAEEP